jgi:MFS family permease
MRSESWSLGRSIAPLLGLNAFATYLTTAQGVVAPFIAKAWSLSDSEITFLAGVISLGALGTLLITRLADRRGRRRALLLGFVASLALSLGSGLAPGVASYALLQILLLAAAGAVQVGTSVAVTEEVADAARPLGQSWYGVIGALGGGMPYLLAPALAGLVGGWRWLWLASAVMLLLVPAVRRSLTETGRFTRAEAEGRTARASVRDLFGTRYARRTAGLLVASGLRPIALVATGTWTYYHAVDTLGLSAGVASGIIIAGGGLGLAGNPLGARLAASWGRRPTHVLGASVTIAAGSAFYFVPEGFPGGQAVGLALCFWVNQLGMNTFSVADRCIDTELFPTALRATYAGMARLSASLAAVVCQFALSALTGWLGSLPAPETRGLSLDQAALEQVEA